MHSDEPYWKTKGERWNQSHIWKNKQEVYKDKENILYPGNKNYKVVLLQNISKLERYLRFLFLLPRGKVWRWIFNIGYYNVG